MTPRFQSYFIATSSDLDRKLYDDDGWSTLQHGMGFARPLYSQIGFKSRGLQNLLTYVTERKPER
jgi:hypothetical protein